MSTARISSYAKLGIAALAIAMLLPVWVLLRQPLASIEDAHSIGRSVIAALTALLLLALAWLAVQTRRLHREKSARANAEREREHAKVGMQTRIEEIAASMHGAIQELQRKEKMLNEAQRLVHIGSFEWDLLGGALAWTDEHFRLWGLEPGSVKPSFELFKQGVHPDDMAHLDAILQKALHGGSAYDCVHRVRWPDGRERDIHARGEVINDAAGRVERLIGTVADITERRQAERQIETLVARLQLATMVAGVGIWERDLVHDVMHYDGVMSHIYGIDPNLLGSAREAWLTTLHPEDAALSMKVIDEALQDEQPHETEFRILRPDGEVRWVRAAAFVQRDGNGAPLRLIGTNWDMTEIKQAEQAIVTSRDAALRAIATKDAFLATMSHELRTPLGPLLGTLELLDRSPLVSEQQELLGGARAAGRALQRIIEDLLDYTSIEAGTLAIRPAAVSIAQVLRRSHRLYQQQASVKGLALLQVADSRISPLLLADAARLTQIIDNMVSNAIKFTSTGSVEISAGFIARSEAGETLCIAVKDSGIGMDSHAQQRLLEGRDQLGTDATRLHGGTGLGMQITRQLVALMGGSLTLHSAPGTGTTIKVTLTLPIVTSASERAPTAGGPLTESVLTAAPANGALVLGVDDHPHNRKLLQRQLALLGIGTVIAESGEQALALWRDGAFGVLLADVNMPGMDGYALTREIRAIEARDARPRTPIIAWTANVLPATLAGCHAAGMDEVLSKPTALDDLRATLHKWQHVAAAQAAAPMPSTPSAAPLALEPAVSAPPVDVRILAELVGNDADMVRELLQDFRTSAARIAQELKAACELGQGGPASALAHKLKSSARSVGALALGECCEAIEHAGNGASTDTLATLLSRFEAEMALVEVFLAEL